MRWAHWDEVDGGRMLVVVSARTIEVWDASVLGTLRQLLAMECEDRVVCARVVSRTCVGVLLPSSLLVYSVSAPGVCVLQQRMGFAGAGCGVAVSGGIAVVVS